jgi:protein-arginine kinase activator protein McsA
MSELLCKECKHSFRSFKNLMNLGTSEYAYTCRLSYKAAHTVISPVVGPQKVAETYDSCGISRLKGKPCGQEGKQWEPKNKKGLFKLIKKEVY